MPLSQSVAIHKGNKPAHLSAARQGRILSSFSLARDGARYTLWHLFSLIHSPQSYGSVGKILHICKGCVGSNGLLACLRRPRVLRGVQYIVAGGPSLGQEGLGAASESWL